MAPKRTLEGVPNEISSKKAKTKLAREIVVQSLSTVSSPAQPPAALSVTPNFTSNSLRGLPTTLETHKFVEARSFEIGAMHKTMLSAREDASKRVWQSLPRHMRRRTASHDSRRVPVRLRAKANAEMDQVKRRKKLKTLAKRGKSELGRTARLLTRQKDKTWLETHIWHAKRMKMDNMWGYRIAIQPTEKAFRPSHRAANHGSILQDVSYFGVVEVQGPGESLKELLMTCCDPQSAVGSASFTSGARACDTHIYEPGSFPYRLVAPCTVLWRPIVKASTAPGGTQPPESDSLLRTIWIRIHPSEFLHVHQIIQRSAEIALQGQDDESIEIVDLRGSLNAFEIMGPKSSQVLSGSLKLTRECSKRKQLWRAIAGLHSPASLPRGMIIGIQVHDPRLSFPPSNTRTADGDSADFPKTFAFQPSSATAETSLWDAEIRENLSKPRFKKKDLDERRASSLLPGTRLSPSESDDRLPLMIIQRTLAPLTAGVRDQVQSSAPIHGFLVLFPKGWSMPIFDSLIYTGTRVGGLREHASQRFEANVPHFPEDYVTTTAYKKHWDTRAAVEQAKWLRTPKAKRPPYNAMPAAGVVEPVVWRPNWEEVLKLERTPDADIIEREPSAPELPETQGHEGADALLDARASSGPALGQSTAMTYSQSSNPLSDEPLLVPWLLHGVRLGDLLKSLSSTSTTQDLLLQHINSLRNRAHLPIYPMASAWMLLKGALVMVNLRMCGRGKPEDLSIIYSMPQNLDPTRYSQINRNECQGHEAIAEGLAQNLEADGPDRNDAAPDPSRIIGYVTTGRFSLQQGRGCAQGAVTLGGLLEVLRRDVRWVNPFEWYTVWNGCRRSTARTS